MKKAIIFDVDGTLLDTERIFMRSWKEAGALFGYDVPHDVLVRTRAISRSLAAAIFQDALGEDFSYPAVQKERIRISEEIIHQCGPNELLMPHTSEVLDQLSSLDVPMAVASSSSYFHTEDHLSHVGIKKHFRAIVGGDMIEHGKPNPDIFLKAAELLNVPAKDCIVVGDTPADVLAEHAAGMPMILIPDIVPVNDQTRELSFHILSSIRELPDFLSQEGFL